MAKSFPDLKKENIQIQEAHKVPNKMNPKRLTPGCIMCNKLWMRGPKSGRGNLGWGPDRHILN